MSERPAELLSSEEDADEDNSSSEGEDDRVTTKKNKRRNQKENDEDADDDANKLSSQSAICDYFVAKVFSVDQMTTVGDAVAKLKLTKDSHRDIKYSKIIVDAG